jgi:hypothetical protein
MAPLLRISAGDNLHPATLNLQNQGPTCFTNKCFLIAGNFVLLKGYAKGFITFPAISSPEKTIS